MKKLLFILSFGITVILFSCGGGRNQAENETKETSKGNDNPSYDPKRGEGKYSAQNLKLEEKINPAVAAEGEKIANVKCFSCHKVTIEKLVGPGWKGVTTRRSPEWIMNFITNPDPMINKDPEAQAMLEICLVRMPNQSLTDENARQVLEFLRNNDKE